MHLLLLQEAMWCFPWPDFGQPFPTLAVSQLANRLVQPFREELSLPGWEIQGCAAAATLPCSGGRQ